MPLKPTDVLYSIVHGTPEKMCPNVPSGISSPAQKSAQMCRNVPDCASGSDLQKLQNEPTAPAPASAWTKPLSARQQAAARLLVLGFGSKRAARQLGINHHTIGRWKNDPRFVALLEKFNRSLDAAAVTVVAQTTPKTPA